MERLVEKIIMSEVNPYWKIEGVSDEFYLANSEEASLEQLQVVQEALKSYMNMNKWIKKDSYLNYLIRLVIWFIPTNTVLMDIMK